MKRLLILILLCGILIVPEISAYVPEPVDIPPQNNAITPPPPEHLVTAEIQYTEKTVTIITTINSFTKKISKMIGLELVQPEDSSTSTTDVDVVQGDQVLASVPVDSPFNGMGVHEHCLDYQYGTINWYGCEQELVSV
jgi:hypothetical protein